MDKYPFLIYGCYGYTGHLVLEKAIAQGIKPLIAGRDRAKTEALAKQFDVAFKVFSLEDTEALIAALQQVPAVLHAAGPFSETSEPMIQACLETKTHYLDITGEIWVFEDIRAKDKAAKEAGIALIPGVGFDVVPSDCLVGFLHQQMQDATSLRLAFSGAQKMSRGTAITMVKNAHKGSIIRENGKLVTQPLAYEVLDIPFANKTQTCMSISWGDIATSWFQTKIPNIRVYTSVDQKTLRNIRIMRKMTWLLKQQWVINFLRKRIKKAVYGPGEETRKTAQSQLWAEMQNAKGAKLSATLTAPEAYELTAQTALAATLKAANGEVPAGYHTPAQAFGPDFILQFDGVTRKLSDS